MHDLLLSPLQLRHATVTAARSVAAMTPPLKPPTGVSIPRRSISMRKPRGGRLLMIAKRIPLARNSATAAAARAVNTLSSVTNVPSTSEITAEHLNDSGFTRLMKIVHHHRRRRFASLGHPAPKAHPLRSVPRFPPDRSADRPGHPSPKPPAPVARHAKRAPPYRRA